MSVLNPVRKIEKTFEDFVFAHRNISKKEFTALVENHLSGFGFTKDVLKVFPHQLSGGMQQRMTIALATILKPRIILADEPTTALDVITQRGVIQLLKKVKEEQQNTIIMITHDMAIHANFCDRIGIMYAGQIVEEAPVETIFKNPQHPYTQYLISSLPAIGDRAQRVSASGAPPSLVNPPTGCRFHPRCPKAQPRCQSECPQMKSVVGSTEDHQVACHLV
jgi:peptide/nickel transport system ATP-binding protein